MNKTKLLIGGAIATAVLVIGSLLALIMLPAILLESDADRTDWGPSEIAYQEIPAPILDAYQEAARNCAGLPWQIVAGIGYIETRHGTYGGSIVDYITGKVSPPIIGIPLNGSNGTKAIRDTDDGYYDQDSVWDRAVGPMQFIPSSWRAFAVHGPTTRIDTPPDPHNIYDAIFSAVVHLCDHNDHLERDVDNAIRIYNNSDAYVRAVKAKALEYGLGFDGRSLATGPDGEVIQGDASVIVAYAMAQKGKPYIWARPTESELDDPDPDAFDCSGLIVWAYRKIGIKLPHFTGALVKLGRNIDPDKEAIEPGDLIFMRGGKSKESGGHGILETGHVGIAISQTKMVQAKGTKYGVVIAPLPTKISGIRRIVEENPNSQEYDEATPAVGDASPPNDPDTRKVTDKAGNRWDLGKVYTEPLTRDQAVTLATIYDRLVATAAPFRAHMLKMRSANKRFEVFFWVNPSDGAMWDITTPDAPQMVAELCSRGLAASGAGGCMLNLPLKPPVPPQCSNPPPPPDPAVTTTTTPTTTTTVVPAPPCKTQATWDAALKAIEVAVKGFGDQDDSDGDILVLTNGRNTHNRLVIKSPDDNEDYTTTQQGQRTPADVNHAFPIPSGATYGTTHHDYPAADMFALCGTKAVSPVDGVIEYVAQTDRWKPELNLPDTRGGLAVAVIGDDGVRYYMSHFQKLDKNTLVNKRVKAGDAIGLVGKTGNAATTPCHVHFGISPRCTTTEWWIRRGVIYPQGWLDKWRANNSDATPQKEIRQWDQNHPGACLQRPDENGAAPG
jgi:peptidoglycan LD-endopeptidase LytH